MKLCSLLTSHSGSAPILPRGVSTQASDPIPPSSPLIHPTSGKGDSRKVKVLGPGRKLPGSGDASRAAHHAHHELDRLLVTHALRASHRTPRLEVQGEAYC